MSHILNIIQHLVFRVSGAKIIPLLIVYDRKTTTFETVIQDRTKRIPFTFTFENKNLTN